jgi:hypothetical protein
MVGYQYADPALAQMPDYSLNIEDGNGVDTGERLIKQDEFWFRSERARDFDAPPLAS